MTDSQRDWKCIRVKVTESLTLMVGINTKTDMIRIRNPYIKSIEAKLSTCLDDEVETVEIFNDYL